METELPPKCWEMCITTRSRNDARSREECVVNGEMINHDQVCARSEHVPVKHSTLHQPISDFDHIRQELTPFFPINTQYRETGHYSKERNTPPREPHPSVT